MKFSEIKEAGDYYTWFTGRVKGEDKFIYENKELTDQTLDSFGELYVIATTIEEYTEKALQNLDHVNGVQSYLGGIPVGSYTQRMNLIRGEIEGLYGNLTYMADQAEAFSTATLGERIGSSIAMFGSKAGEGFLGFFEDLGDSAASLIGWIGGDKTEKKMQKFIEKEWSHDAFNFYYNSDFAKKAAFTEDSFVANAFKFAGEVGAWYVTGGAITKFAVGAADGVITIPGKVITNTLSSTTKTNAILAGLAGDGSKTELQLSEGKDFDAAARAGAVHGAEQAALVYTIGKVAEKGSSSGMTQKVDDVLSDASNSVDDLGRQFAEAQQKLDDAYANGASDATLGKLEEARDIAKNAFEDANNKLVVDDLGNKLSKAQQKLDDAYANGASDSTLGVLEESRDAAKQALDDALNKGKPTTQASNVAGRTSSKTMEDLGKQLSEAQQKLDDAYANGASDATLGRLEEARDATAKALNEANKSVIDDLGKQFSEAQQKLDDAYANGASDATLGRLEEARDATAKALENAGGDVSKVKEATSALENAQNNLDNLFKNGASEAEQGAAELARDEAKQALDDVLNTSKTTAQASNVVEQTRVKTTEDLGKQLSEAQQKLDNAYANGASDATLGRLEASRDTAKNALDDVLNKGKTTTQASNVVEQTRVKTTEDLGKQLSEAQQKLDNAYANGASDATLGRLEASRDAAKQALDDALKTGNTGTQTSNVLEGTSARTTKELSKQLSEAQQKLDDAYANGASDATLGRLEEARDTAKHALDTALQNGETASIPKSNLASIKSGLQSVGRKVSETANKVVNDPIGTIGDVGRATVQKSPDITVGALTANRVSQSNNSLENFGRINTGVTGNNPINLNGDSGSDLMPKRYTELEGEDLADLTPDKPDIPTTDAETNPEVESSAPISERSSSSGTYQYRQYPDDLSGEASEGVTAGGEESSSDLMETHVDENGHLIGGDEAYLDTDEDISGTAMDGVTVENPDVTSGETGKSWATYDPENGYDSLENQQARLAKEKVTAMFDKLKNNTGNENISGTATDGVTVENPSVIPSDARKSWATYDPVNGYDSLEEQQARLAREREAALNNPVKPSITTPGSESTNPVSVNPETNINDKQTIVTPPSDTSSSSGTTYHSGGGYTPPASSSNNNQSSYVAPTPEATPTPEPVQEPVVETPQPEVEKPVEDIVPKESKVTKIPTVTPPNNTKEVSGGGGGSRIIPIAAGIGAAAAAGLGAKAYLDRKENTDNGEEDEWDTEVDEGDKPIDINYEDKPEEGESVLEDDDEYTASDEEEIVERYDARANDELADLQ